MAPRDFELKHLSCVLPLGSASGGGSWQMVEGRRRQAFAGVLDIHQIDEGSVSPAGLRCLPSVPFVMMGNGAEAKPESQ